MRTPQRLRISLAFGEADASPEVIKDCIGIGDRLGFSGAWISDHFMPTLHSGNRAPFVWSLLAACLEGTRRITLGPLVTTPIGGRYHPAVIAQACATLDCMYPNRFVMAVGTGEAVNEAPFFDGWIPWQQRMDRLVEGTRLIRRLWKSKSFFDFKGRYFPMTRTVLYTRPKTPLNIYFSAFGAKSAHYAGEYGDGIVTSVSGDVDKSIQQCREVIFSSFDEGARKVRRDPATMARVVGVYFTFQGERAYLASARKYAGMFSSQSVDERDPRRLESLGESVSDEDLLNAVFLCSSWSDMTEVLSKLEEAGATEVYLMLGANKRLIGASARKLLGFRRLNAP